MAYNLRIAERVRQHGLLRAVEDIGIRAANRITLCKILHCMKLETVHSEFLETPTGYHAMFLENAQLRAFTRMPVYEFHEGFVEQAFDKGDRCYGVLTDDGVLAAYQWYATTPTWYFAPCPRTLWNGIRVSFAEKYLYVYKSFTHPDHRGKRLHPTCITSVLASSQAHGCRGMLAIVESNNFASLKACYRTGYRDFGKAFLAVLFNQCLISQSAGCKREEFRLTKHKEIPPVR